MDTIVKNSSAKVSVNTGSTTKIATQSKFWEAAEFNRFGIISMLLVIIACLNGISAAYGAQGDAVKIGLLAFSTVLAESLILAVAPMKTIFLVSVASLVLDVFVFIF